MPRIKLLYVVWFFVCVAVVLMMVNYKSESTQFYGIAETQEISVSSESAVALKRIHVVAGQTVSRGDLLAELHDPALVLSINTISHEIEETKNELAAQTSAINYSIKQLEAKDAINHQLIGRLKSLGTAVGKEPPAETPIRAEIEGLRKSLALRAQPLQTKINMLERQLSLLQEKKSGLNVYAQVDGIIGTVRCKENEQIAPFQSIMTLHTKSPCYIKGYVHEFAYTQIAVGQRVTVISLANPAYSLTGEVVGADSKIIEYPTRLKRVPTLSVYGREVQIRIPEKNNLLFGEKVMIRAIGDHESFIAKWLKKCTSLMRTAIAHESTATGQEQDAPAARDVTVGKALSDAAPLELSGILYFHDLKKYLVVSDTTTRKRPVLFLMNDEGVAESEVPLPGLDRIDDMESITEDLDGKIYVACSQSAASRHSPTAERKLLVRLTREGALLRLDGKLSLYDLLCDAAQKNPDLPWARLLIAPKDHSCIKINIEGMFCSRGDLYLGLKRPLDRDRAVILKIKNINRIFADNRLERNSVEIWKAFKLTDSVSRHPSGISDLMLLDNKLYILAVPKHHEDGEKKKGSSLWQYDIAADRLTLVSRLDHVKAEGITFNTDTKEWVIVCDHGKNEPSKFLKKCPVK